MNPSPSTGPKRLHPESTNNFLQNVPKATSTPTGTGTGNGHSLPRPPPEHTITSFKTPYNFELRRDVNSPDATGNDAAYLRPVFAQLLEKII